MGNEHKSSEQSLLIKQPTKLREAELTDTESIEESLYEEREEDTNCFGCIKTKKTVLKKIDWEYKFSRNCIQVMEEFQWAKELAQLVNTLDLPKEKYYRQVSNLKKEKYVAVTTEMQRPSEKELQVFRKNLKKSVIMSFSSKVIAQARQSTIINVKKSRIEQQQKNSKIASKSEIIVERSLSGRSNNNIKRSIIEFIDEPNANNQQQPPITKSNTHQLEIFMKFSNKLEIHLNDNQCVLGRVKAEFIRIMLSKYGNAAKASAVLGDFVDDVKQFLLLLKQGVVDFYALASFGKNGVNTLIANDENILSSCTSILFMNHQFYNLLFSAISTHFQPQQRKFSKILDLLRGSGPERFTVKDKFCLNQRTLKAYLNQMSAESGENIVENIEIDHTSENYDPFKRCQESLNELVKSRSPVNKMKAIAACSEGITREIEAFYDRNCLKKEKWMLDADQVLSIFSYIIVAARVQHLHTQLFLLDNFANGFQMINMTGYYMAVLNCAVEHLQNEFGHLVDE